MGKAETQVDKAIAYFKNHRLFSIFILFALLIGGLAQLTTSLATLSTKIFPKKAMIEIERIEVIDSNVDLVIRNVGQVATTLQFIEPIVLHRTAIPNCIGLKTQLPVSETYDFYLGAKEKRLSLVHDLQPQEADRVNISLAEYRGGCSANYYYQLQIKAVFGTQQDSTISKPVDIKVKPQRNCVGIVVGNVACLEQQERRQEDLSEWWPAMAEQNRILSKRKAQPQQLNLHQPSSP